MPGYRISFCLLVVSLLMLPEVGWAEWVALDARYQSHPLQTAYIDSSTIRREGQVSTLSTLIDWKAMQGGRTPTRFYSTKITKQFDCAEKLVRTLAATDYDHHMGTGEVIGGGVPASEGHWVVIEPGTINHGLWEAACGIH
ncbi:MAG: hypothetical protein OEU68_07060 [Nitrospira sp.]|jgi:hypothetical protein|nr:hypothetical protein [Nitrospira sp.]MDH4242959.1 hypothetical protein [Nitrospira sp.]MDH4358026.1 hypothetical protein [Nitrospira sp.]